MRSISFEDKVRNTKRDDFLNFVYDFVQSYTKVYDNSCLNKLQLYFICSKFVIESWILYFGDSE